MPESCNKQKQRSAWQWLSKHIPRAMNIHTMIDELLEAVSMWPVPKLYMFMDPKGHRTKSNWLRGQFWEYLQDSQSCKKYGHKPHRIWNHDWLCWWRPSSDYCSALHSGPLSGLSSHQSARTRTAEHKQWRESLLSEATSKQSIHEDTTDCKNLEVCCSYLYIV